MKISKDSSKIGLVQSDLVLKRICHELYRSGLSLYKIARLLKVPEKRVFSFFEENTNPHPAYPVDESSPIVQKILYDYDVPVSSEVLIENEKARYAEYSKLEKNALDLMNLILSHYLKKGVIGELKEDKELAKMAAELIKVTHSARQELIQKYAIDKESDEQNKNKVEIEFI